MGQFKGYFYEMVMRCVPDIDPLVPATRDRVLRATRWLSILRPIICQLDGTEEGGGTPDGDLLAGIIACLLDLDDACVLNVALVSPQDVVHMPTMATGYERFYNGLSVEILNAIKAKAELRLGHAVIGELIHDFWLNVACVIDEQLHASYGAFCRHVDRQVEVNFTYGFINTVLAVVLAVVADDEEGVRLVAPLARQIAMGLPVGCLTGDPQRWYVMLPSLPATDDESED